MTKNQVIKKGDTVWVNEWTLSGKPLEHEWYGKVITIQEDKDPSLSTVTVEDTTNRSYRGEIFTRMLSNLEKKE